MCAGSAYWCHLSAKSFAISTNGTIRSESGGAAGRPDQIHEHSGPDSKPIEKIVREIVYLPPDGPTPLEDEDEPVISYSALKINNTQ